MKDTVYIIMAALAVFGLYFALRVSAQLAGRIKRFSKRVFSSFGIRTNGVPSDSVSSVSDDRVTK